MVDRPSMADPFIDSSLFRTLGIVGTSGLGSALPLTINHCVSDCFR